MRFIKNIIKKSLSCIGFEVRRYDPIPDFPFDLLELVVNNSIQKACDFFIVQAGANNGVMGDPIHKLIKKYHLPALLVEPLPEQFKELCNNYKGEEQLLFENCAISETNGVQSLYRFKKAPEIPEWAYGMASFNKNHLLKFKDTLSFSKYIEEISVPTMTINDLLQKHSIKKIDLLQIDTEGYDYNIIKMIFDSKIYPTIINYEHEHLNSDQHIACKKLLINNDYKFITYGRDILAIHNQG